MTDDLERRLRQLEEERNRLTQTNVARAAELAADMMAMAEGAGPVARALALRAYGNSFRAQGKLPQALAAITEAQQLWLEVGDRVEWARTVIAAIPVLVHLDRNEDAIQASRLALEHLLSMGELAIAARLLGNMGGMYGNMGQSLNALECLTRAKALALQTGQPNHYAIAAQNRALVLQQLGRHRESLSDCAAALRHWLKQKAFVGAAKTLQAGAIALLQLGHFGKALRRFARARAMFDAQSSQRDVAVCDLYIAACYLELNRCDQTLARTRAVMAVLDPVDNGFQFAWAHLYEGVALSRLGNDEAARRATARACRWFEQHGHAPWAGKARLEEGEQLLSQGRAREASQTAGKAARLFAAAHMPVEEGRARLLLAEGSLAAGRLAEAERAASYAYRIFVRSHMPGLIFRCLHLLGRIAMERRDWETAARRLSRAVATAERLRATVHLSFRREFLDDKASAYSDLVWVYLRQGRIRAAHRLVDLAKSRTLADALTGFAYRRRGKTSATEQALLAEINTVRLEYAELSAPAQFGPEQAVVLRSGAVATPTERRAELESRLAALWDEWELRQTTLTSPGALTHAGRRPTVRRLPAGTAMVEFFAADSRLVAFVSDRRGLRGWVELGAPESVRRNLELLQLNLDSALWTVAQGQRVPRPLDRNARALLGQLYQQIWAPLLPLLGERQSVVIVPHDLLHLVPFEALHDGQQYLVEQMEISLAPSRAVWAQCMTRGELHLGGADLVMGYSHDGALPFVDAEARTVAGALGTEALLGEQATGRRLAAENSRRVVHIALHGEFRQDNPYFSTLLMADGTLTATDVTFLHMESALVVLSGCETGLSRVTRGDELMGMVSAFLQAGSASVLASRWRVDDRVTADLMARFYERLLAGRGKAAALREAQVAMAAQELHPLYWAAFGLVGHGGPLQ